MKTLVSSTVFAMLAAAGCATAAPSPTATVAAPSPTAPPTATATLAPPATASATSTTASTPTTAVSTSAPAAATTFHLLMSDGPRMGGYDVASSSPTDCAYVSNLERWNANFLGPPPLNFISASLDEDLPTLLVTFDRDSPNAVSFRSIGDVTYEVDDRGDSATLSVVSEENEADFGDGSPSITTGRVELTVECGAPYRY